MNKSIFIDFGFHQKPVNFVKKELQYGIND